MVLLKEAGLSFILTIGLLWLVVQLIAAQLTPKSLNWNLTRLQVESLNYRKDETFLKSGGYSVTVSCLAHLLNLPLGLQIVEKTHSSFCSCSWVCIAYQNPALPPAVILSLSYPSHSLVSKSSGFLACVLSAPYEVCYSSQVQHSFYPVYQATDFYLCGIIKYVPWGGMNPMQHTGLEDIEFISHDGRGLISHLGFYATTVPQADEVISLGRISLQEHLK